jgi:hypothetical protein
MWWFPDYKYIISIHKEGIGSQLVQASSLQITAIHSLLTEINKVTLNIGFLSSESLNQYKPHIHLEIGLE